MTSNGAVLTRNIADANTAMTINQSNSGSTGDILDLQAAGTTKDVFTYAGYLGVGTSTPTKALSVVGDISNILAAGSNIPTLVSSTTMTGFNDFYVKGKYLYGVDNGSVTGKMYVVDI